MTDGTAAYAYLDLCFLEFCNLTCAYCRTSNEGMVRDQDPAILKEAVTAFLEHSEAAVLKVSGYGEVAHWKPLAAFMGWAAPRFPAVQVMTNGTMPRPVFDALAAIPGMTFCLTLDSFLPDHNALRTGGSGKLHDRMVAFAGQVVEAGIPLEMNCVLTATNIALFPEHVAEVGRRFGPDVLVYPFPVRPFRGLDPVAGPASSRQVDGMAERLFGDFGRYAANLPPRPYMERLLGHMRRGGRGGEACRVPVTNYGVGPTLTPLHCACLGHTKPSDDLANMRFGGDSGAGVQSRMIDLRPTHPGLIAQGFVDERCEPCFTHYEVLNLYLDGTVTLDELCQLPAFRPPGARRLLARLGGAVAGLARRQEPRHTVEFRS